MSVQYIRNERFLPFFDKNGSGSNLWNKFLASRSILKLIYSFCDAYLRTANARYMGVIKSSLINRIRFDSSIKDFRCGARSFGSAPKTKCWSLAARSDTPLFASRIKDLKHCGICCASKFMSSCSTVRSWLTANENLVWTMLGVNVSDDKEKLFYRRRNFWCIPHSESICCATYTHSNKESARDEATWSRREVHLSESRDLHYWKYLVLPVTRISALL